VSHGCSKRRGICGQRAGGREGFIGASARQQECRPLFAVQLLRRAIERPQLERPAEHRLGGCHPTRVLKRHPEEIQVVAIVPIVFDRDLFRLQVRTLQPVGCLELGNRVLDAIRAAKHVTVHVVRVRHRRRRGRVPRCVDEGAIDAVDVFVRVRHVVMDGEVLRRPREGPLVKSQRRIAHTHAVPIGRRILRLPDEQQKLDVPRIFCQDLIEPLPVRDVKRSIVGMGRGVELIRPQPDAKPFAFGRGTGQLLGVRVRITRLGRQAQLAQRFAEPNKGHRKSRVVAQRFVE
jgi:hypothetical protein